MKARRIVLRGRQRDRLLRLARGCRDPHLRVRYMVVVHSADGWRVSRIAEALGCSCSTVTRARRRWRRGGAAALADGRARNGHPKVDRRYVAVVRRVLRGSPPDFGHRRPTWTQDLLVRTARRFARRTVSVTTMGRVLARLRVRRGRPKPAAPRCPWSNRRKRQRLALIHRLVEALPPDQSAVWLDQVQVDLNPRVGLDWMLPGTQRRVVTPGRNVRRFVAGAMDARTDRLTWLAGERNDTALLLGLLEKLSAAYRHKHVVHVILDNYAVHGGKRVRAWLAARRRPQLRLQFLPPYCPDDNRIERRVWRELHQNVTVNHRHRTIESLMRAVEQWLDARESDRSESRKAI